MERERGYGGEALKPDFKTYAQSIIDNAKALADTLLDGGVQLVSGGTDNHLVLLDVTSLGTTGRIAEDALGHCDITVNKNMIPFDPRKPMDPSGIRIGTPALTTRGMGVSQMKEIGDWIIRCLKAPDDTKVLDEIKNQVGELCQHFPVPASAITV